MSTRPVLGALLLLGPLLAAGGCRSQPQPVASEPPTYTPTATIKDLMLSIVDPSADVVWQSVTTTMTDTGPVETAPRTEEEWTKVRAGAITLVEAANLLLMPGRRVARPGEKSDTPGVELEPEEMDALIAKDRAAWNGRAQALHEASVAVLQAVEAKDPEKVFELGDRIDAACEACHKHYWYPNEKIPAFPANAR